MGSLEKKLGSRVAYHRKIAKVTQAELAERVSVATETISRLERGAAIPSLARLEKVAIALGRELYELFQDDKPGDRSVDRRGVALDHLVASMASRSAEDIHLVTEIALRIFERRPAPNAKSRLASSRVARGKPLKVGKVVTSSQRRRP
jgi:transcriptional regulator with XRE-family HTH domain